MLSGSAKISGHRFTRFKNRKVFERVKDFGKKRMPISNGKESLNDFAKYNYLKKSNNSIFIALVKIFAVIINLLIVGIALNFVIDSIHSIESYQSVKNEIKRKQTIEDYNILTSGGYAYLNQKRYDLALEEFTLALKINQYGIFANRGLLQVLIKQCQIKSQFCDDLEMHQEFNLQSNYVDKQELDVWYSK